MMEVSGSNRYELLFDTDDDGPPAPVVPAVPAAKKKPAAATVTVPAKSSQATNKKSNTEKENKSSALNKNVKTAGSGGASQPVRPKNVSEAEKSRGRPLGASSGPSTFDGPRPKVGTDEKGLRDGRRNVRESGGFSTGEYNNDNQHRQPRPFRDRDDRGPPRNRYGENNFRGGKREFDRQSGSDKTGVKSVDKREGGGAHNWGSVKQEINDINKAIGDDPVLTDKDESANEQSALEPGPVPEEEETKEMTLDEWKAMRQQRAKPQYNLRKAGEGEDDAQWKKMVVLNKKKEGANSEDEDFEYDPSLYPQRVGRLQRIVDIQFNFSDSRRGGGGFGRGRGRGPRPGVGDRVRFEGIDDPQAKNNFNKPQRNKPQRVGTSALKVDDERQFPTLS